jgi:hypothetical protein
VEPVRQSVMGAGLPAAVKPPATVISRQVVAVRTPPPPSRPIDQRQAEAGGHLNQQTLVRQAMPASATPVNQGAREQQSSQEGFRRFTPPPNGNAPVNQLPEQPRRTVEMQGTPEPEKRNVESPAENRNARLPENRHVQAEQSSQPAQTTHPLVRPAPPVQERNPQNEEQQERKFHDWQQQRAASPAPAPRQQSSRPAESRPASPSKPKGH